MPLEIDLGASVGGLKAVRLENDRIRVTVLLEVGAKIYDLVSKPSGRQVLWHNPRIRPQRFPIEANLDNYWCGGWDEGFPTCDACEYRGEHYPNLGELRSIEWTIAGSGEAAGYGFVRLEAFGPISPARARKTVALAPDSPVVSVRCEIASLGPAGIEFLWGSHPALAVTADTVFRIPARAGIVGISSSARMGAPGQRYKWPHLSTESGAVDMSCALPFEANESCGHYATSLDAGWFAAEDRSAGHGVLFTFPVEQCPHLWLWLSYGGGRGYHHAIIEPWTSCPVNLAEAARAGAARRLQPRATFSAEVRAVPYEPPATWSDALRQAEGTP